MSGNLLGGLFDNNCLCLILLVILILCFCCNR